MQPVLPMVEQLTTGWFKGSIPFTGNCFLVYLLPHIHNQHFVQLGQLGYETLHKLMPGIL